MYFKIKLEKPFKLFQAPPETCEVPVDEKDRILPRKQLIQHTPPWTHVSGCVKHQMNLKTGSASLSAVKTFSTIDCFQLKCQEGSTVKGRKEQNVDIELFPDEKEALLAGDFNGLG